MQLKLADLLAAQMLRRLAEVLRELLDRQNVAASRVGRVVTALEFLQHPLT